MSVISMYLGPRRVGSEITTRKLLLLHTRCSSVPGPATNESEIAVSFKPGAIQSAASLHRWARQTVSDNSDVSLSETVSDDNGNCVFTAEYKTSHRLKRCQKRSGPSMLRSERAGQVVRRVEPQLQQRAPHDAADRAEHRHLQPEGQPLPEGHAHACTEGARSGV